MKNEVTQIFSERIAHLGKENNRCACVTELFKCSLLAPIAKNLQNAHATEYSLLFAPVLVVHTCNAHIAAASNIPEFVLYVPRRCVDTPWYHERGRGRCRRPCPLDFENCSKERLFHFSFEWEHPHFTIFAHSRRILEKYLCGPPGHANAGTYGTKLVHMARNLSSGSPFADI